MENEEKVKNLLGMARKAGYLIIGSDNLLRHTKKLYLVVKDKETGITANKVFEKYAEENIVETFLLEKFQLSQLIQIEKCQIVGIRNKGMADAIKKLLI